MTKKSTQSFLTLGKRYANKFLALHLGTVLVDEQAEVRLRGFALAFDRIAKASTIVFNANSSDFISEVSCSLSSSSLLLKSVTNLFNPWEILTHEWELSLFTDSILISTSIFTFAGSWLWLLTRAQLWYSLESKLSARWFFISWQSVLTTCQLVL